MSLGPLIIDCIHSSNIEAALARLGRHIRLLHVVYTGGRWTLVEVLDELFDCIGAALSLALDLEEGQFSRREEIGKSYRTVRGVGYEAGEANAFGLLAGEGPSRVSERTLNACIHCSMNVVKCLNYLKFTPCIVSGEVL